MTHIDISWFRGLFGALSNVYNVGTTLRSWNIPSGAQKDGTHSGEMGAFLARLLSVPDGFILKILVIIVGICSRVWCNDRHPKFSMSDDLTDHAEVFDD